MGKLRYWERLRLLLNRGVGAGCSLKSWTHTVITFYFRMKKLGSNLLLNSES